MTHPPIVDQKFHDLPSSVVRTEVPDPESEAAACRASSLLFVPMVQW